MCRKSENCSKGLVAIFFKNLFGKLVHIFREVSAYFRSEVSAYFREVSAYFRSETSAYFREVSAYFREVSAYIFARLVHIFRSETSFQNFKTSFEKFGAIMATGGLQ